MSRSDYIVYFMALDRSFRGHGGNGTPDRLQGGIGVIRAPYAYATHTLAYWYEECKRAGY